MADDELEQARAILHRGGLVAVPTETVYGLGVDCLNVAAVRRMFAVKGRPADHPVIVHMAPSDELGRWAVRIPAIAERLAAALWPGPLTLVLHRDPRIPDVVTGGLDSVGIRVPDHPRTIALLERFGSIIAAPSANRFGSISPTTAEHVRVDLGDDVDLVLEGGSCRVGLESTIVDVRDPAQPRILRPGGIAAATISAIAGIEVAEGPADAVRAPGMLRSHYAPRTPVEILGPDEILARAADGAHIAVLTDDAELAARITALRPSLPVATALPGEPFAHALYAALRRLDAAGTDAILCTWPKKSPLADAIADRLRRAATR